VGRANCLRGVRRGHYWPREIGTAGAGVTGRRHLFFFFFFFFILAAHFSSLGVLPTRVMNRRDVERALLMKGGYYAWVRPPDGENFWGISRKPGFRLVPFAFRYGAINFFQRCWGLTLDGVFFCFCATSGWFPLVARFTQGDNRADEWPDRSEIGRTCASFASLCFRPAFEYLWVKVFRLPYTYWLWSFAWFVTATPHSHVCRCIYMRDLLIFLGSLFSRSVHYPKQMHVTKALNTFVRVECLFFLPLTCIIPFI